jgi:hypothetical protein
MYKRYRKRVVITTANAQRIEQRNFLFKEEED